MNRKILIAYFSYEGNTRRIAQKIQAATGGDLFEIRPLQSYPADYDTAERQARREVREGFHPQLTATQASIADYDLILIGTPNWFNKVAPPVATFLTGSDFTAKIVVPFCTHGGNGATRVAADMAGYIAGARVLECLDIYGDGGATADAAIGEWLRRVGVKA